MRPDYERKLREKILSVIWNTDQDTVNDDAALRVTNVFSIDAKGELGVVVGCREGSRPGRGV